MPWYYIWCHHGPGHQSTTDKFLYKAESVPIKTSSDIEKIADEAFGYRDWGEGSAIFRVKKVAKLPFVVRERLTRAYKNQIENATAMLDVLRRTDTYPPTCAEPAMVMEIGRTYPCIRDKGHKGKCDGRYWKRDQARHGRID